MRHLITERRLIMQDRVIIIKLDGWVTVYFKGNKYAEGHSLSSEEWIKLGILICEAGMDSSKIFEKWIDEEDVSDESLLWDWPENINNLDDEIINIIKYSR